MSNKDRGKTESPPDYCRAALIIACLIIIVKSTPDTCKIVFFVCAASSLEFGRASVGNNCSGIIDIKAGSSVRLHCNLSCITDNFTQWNYYVNSIDTDPTVLHNGITLNPSWASRGVSVVHNKTSAQSVLEIKEAQLNDTGIYECSTDSGDYGGCRMQFCLQTGEHLSLHNLFT